MQQQDNHEYPFLYQRQTCHQVQPNQATYQKRQKCQPATYLQEVLYQLDTLAFLLLLSLLLPSLLIMFIPSTFKRPVSSWKALNLRKTLLMASSVRLKPLNCSRLPCVYAQETLTFLLTQKKTCVKNYVQKE